MAERSPHALRFGRYEALLRLGVGGMAEVFAARLAGEAGFQKLVAVKRMLPHLAEDPQLVERFFDEARIAAHIASPHVVGTLDVGRSEDGAPYIVLELVVGVPLSAILAREIRFPRLPLATMVELLAQVADGLDDAHRAKTPDGRALGVVHRDVSPQNVLVGVDGRARLTDFGVAQAVLKRAQTAAGLVFGKHPYMSPEQIAGRDVDRRTDVFSLGVVAWEAIARRRLFSGETPQDTIRRVLSMPIPRVDAGRSDVPASLADAIAAALERDLEARAQTAGELARSLRKAARELGDAPEPSQIAECVSDVGGAALADVQSRIAAVLRASDGAEPEPTATVTMLEGTVNISGEESKIAPAPIAADVVTTVVLPPRANDTLVDPAPPAPPARSSPPMSIAIASAAAALVLVVLAIVIVTWLSGCGSSEGTLEAELMLPAAPDPAACAARWARVQAVFGRDTGSPSCAFDREWPGAAESAGIALEAAPHAVPITVVASGADVDEPLCLRVRFCGSADCSAPEDTDPREATVRIDPAFEPDRRTRAQITIADACADSDALVAAIAAD